MNNDLQNLLGHLLDVLDPERQELVEQRHQRALNWETTDRLPVIMTYPLSADSRFTPYPHAEIFQSPEKMLFNELVHAFHTGIASREVLDDDLPCTIRANFGTVVIASMFGANVEQVGDNPPWVRHDGTGDAALKSVLDHDPLDFSKGWCPRVEETAQYYADALSEYPKLKQLIQVVLPDLQGPFDNLELIVGSDLFASLYTEPDLVQKALEAMATAQIGLARRLEPWISEHATAFSHQHATMIKGRVLLRDDSVILMSPEMYRTQVASHDERVLLELGGGGVHTCGNADIHIPVFLDLPSIRCLDLGQSELNDIDGLYPQIKQRQLPLTRLKVSREDLVTGRILKQFPTGVSLLYEAGSILDAKETMKAYAWTAK